MKLPVWILPLSQSVSKHLKKEIEELTVTVNTTAAEKKALKAEVEAAAAKERESVKAELEAKFAKEREEIKAAAEQATKESLSVTLRLPPKPRKRLRKKPRNCQVS